MNTNAMTVDQAPITESEAFKRWFGDSKVVDENGEPLVVYHGTDEEFTTFKYGEFGFHFGNKAQASMLGGIVMPVYLRIENPLVFDVDFSNWGDEEKVSSYLVEQGIITEEEAQLGDLQGLLMRKGYDGYVYPNGFEGGGTSYAVFSPEQIRPGQVTKMNDSTRENKPMIIGFNVYRAPEGSAEEFCGYVAVENGDITRALEDCRKLADTGVSLPESLYGTARAAGHVAGMAAPDKSGESDEPYEWFGQHCAVAVRA